METEKDRLINQRYRVVRPIGEGGMGAVHLVRDTLHGGREIALKILHPEAVDPVSIERFKNEFRSLTRLRHPNLVEVHDFGVVQESGRHFLTLEYVEGQDLGTYRWPGVREQFDGLVVQCLRALDYIHARGLLHNDIKPQNILVRPPLQVKVLDFGLARQQASPSRSTVSGTIHYTAPERLRGASPDARSDLYSLGVVLYEILTGVSPYAGTDDGGLIDSILQGRVRRPVEVAPGIPERLERFVLSLLAHDPSERPSSSAAALDLLNTDVTSPYPLDTPETVASFVTSGRFIGRDEELEELIDLATDHAGGRPGEGAAPRLVLVVGESGIGKSRLLREVRHRLQVAGIPTLTGHCYEETGVSFQPFIEVLRQLPRGADFPMDLNPVLDHVLQESAATPTDPTATPPPPSETLEKPQLIAGLARALNALALDSPGVILLEDLHWSDALSIELLKFLLDHPQHGSWLILASLRDETGEDSPARDLIEDDGVWAGLRRIDLDPLDPEEVAEFLTSMVPFEARPSRLARLLSERADGNPLYVEELVKSLALGGSLRRGTEAWTIEDRALEDLKLPASLLGILTGRIAGLPPALREALEMLSIFGRPVSPPLLARALGRATDTVMEEIGRLEQLRLSSLEIDRTGNPIASLSHNRVREAIREGIPEERLRDLHRAAGNAIEETAGSGRDEAVEELAHHFYAAGESERAVEYCIRAAERARSLFYPERRIRFLLRALEHLSQDRTDRRAQVLTDLAYGCIYDLVDYENGLRYCRLLLEMALGSKNRAIEARALRLESWASSFVGDGSGALDVAQRSLTAARAASDAGEIGRSLNNIGTLLGRQGRFREALVYLEEANTILRAFEDPVTLTIYNSLGLCHLLMGNLTEARAIQEKGLDKARELGATSRYYEILYGHGLTLYETGDLHGAIRTLEEALAWGNEHAVSLRVRLLTHLGLLDTQRGLFDRAVRALEEHRSIRRGVVDVSEQIMALEFLGNAFRDLARHDRAEGCHREGIDLARRYENRVQEGFLLAALAADHLESRRTGSAEEIALEALLIGRELDHLRIRFRALAVLADSASRRGVSRDASRFIRDMTRLNPRLLSIRDRLDMNLILGRCALSADRPIDAEREARYGLEVAGKGGFREFEWRYHALLAEAMAARGLPDDADAAYKVASDVIHAVASEIEDPEMRKDYEDESTRREVIRRAEKSGPSSDPDRSTAAEADRRVRMLTTIYEISQVVNSIQVLEDLLNKVTDLAIEIVRAERGLVFLYHSETDEMEMVAGRNVEGQTVRDATEYSRSILREAGRGRSILSHDAVVDDRFKRFRSISAYQIRSLMCVPLTMRDRTIGTVYVDTRTPGHSFSEDDLQFLEAFANQAAIAIENARLYEQLRHDNRSLRQAVEERYGFENIIGRSDGMRALFAILSRVAPSDLSVLIRGESGTGKELVAHAVHQNSPRKERRFFTENCAAFPDNLLESELFGHVRGAFTGADSARKGLFELADGGSLFMDEVGDMSPTMQSKLLRVLQEGEIRPVGSEKTRRVDVRVISATNRDLEQMVQDRSFREDLYFRLNVVSIRIPPLRDRREDIPLLVDHFLERIARKQGGPKLGVDPGLMASLTRHDWPGNVRELENQIHRLVVFADGPTLTRNHARLDTDFSARMTPAGTRGVETGVTRQDLKSALSRAGGNRDEAARILGISRSTMFRKMRQLGVAESRSRRGRRSRPPTR